MERTLKAVLAATASFALPLSSLASANSPSIGVMFYNAYNLFDAEHDEDKNDWEFLPKNYPGKAEGCAAIQNVNYRDNCLASDWTSEKVDLKLDQLEKAFLSTTEGEMPDLLGLAEVENENVVARLTERLGFTSYAMTSSPDHRGIDVALLYKTTALTYVRKQEHQIRPEANSSERTKPTRNILEVEFKLRGTAESLSVFVNHWPSQGAPAPVRVAVARQLKNVIDQRLSESANQNILVMGDFNVIDADYPHPIKSVLTEGATHNPLKDVHDLFLASAAPKPIKWKMPYGTYFYAPEMAWNRLDRFFVNGNLLDNRGLELDPETYRILANRTITRSSQFSNDRYYSAGSTISGLPMRGDTSTNSPEKAGFSDHLPIFLKLKTTK